MALHLAVLSEDGGKRIALLVAYEDGRVELWTCSLAALLARPKEWDGRKASDGLWTRVWEGKTHNEAGELS